MNHDPQQQGVDRKGDAERIPDALVVDLGKQGKKQLERLFAGEGALYGEVKTLISDLRSSGKLPESAMPVVVVVREKRGKKKKGKLGLGL
jgi:hypothetical protein